MNIVVGKITQEARVAIEAAGGTIEPIPDSETSKVTLSGNVVRLSIAGQDFIPLPTNEDLIFTAALMAGGHRGLDLLK
jgi:hypothetical protein